MTVQTFTKEIRTQGRNDCLEITDAVQEAMTRSKVRKGLATVFVTGSTAGVTTIEHEPGLVEDLKDALQRLFPEDLRYAHHETGGDDLTPWTLAKGQPDIRQASAIGRSSRAWDDNGFAHLRAAFIGPSLSVPIVDGKLQLGTWQQIVLIDFDTHPRSRSYLVQILGE